MVGCSVSTRVVEGPGYANLDLKTSINIYITQVCGTHNARTVRRVIYQNRVHKVVCTIYLYNITYSLKERRPGLPLQLQDTELDFFIRLKIKVKNGGGGRNNSIISSHKVD